MGRTETDARSVSVTRFTVHWRSSPGTAPKVRGPIQAQGQHVFGLPSVYQAPGF